MPSIRASIWGNVWATIWASIQATTPASRTKWKTNFKIKNALKVGSLHSSSFLYNFIPTSFLFHFALSFSLSFGPRFFILQHFKRNSHSVNAHSSSLWVLLVECWRSAAMTGIWTGGYEVHIMNCPLPQTWECTSSEFKVQSQTAWLGDTILEQIYNEVRVMDHNLWTNIGIYRSVPRRIVQTLETLNSRNLDSKAEALRELIRFLIRKTQISQFFLPRADRYRSDAFFSFFWSVCRQWSTTKPGSMRNWFIQTFLNFKVV